MKLTNEIIRELKANKTGLRTLDYLTKDTQTLVLSGASVKGLLFLNDIGMWVETGTLEKKFGYKRYALPEDYQEIPEPPEGEWVELSIHNDGTYVIGGFARHWDCIGRFHMDGKLYTFGGWKFEGRPYYTTDRYGTDTDGTDTNGRIYWGCDTWERPAVPVKIRFWKEKL
jgi:hypothetical protein